MTYAPPSGNPADYGNMAGLLRIAMSKQAQQTDDMLPARVVAYDRATNRASVQPLVQVVTTDGRALDRATIPSVPVFQYAGGGFVLSFPLRPGDLGWIKANDRDISLFLQSLAAQEPNTERMHSFQDGLFIPDVMRQWTLDGEDADRVVLQTEDGATRIALGDGIVRVVTGGDVEVEAAVGVTVTAPLVTINGSVIVNGALEATGGLTGADGLVFETHKHLGVTAGAGTSGGPTP